MKRIAIALALSFGALLGVLLGANTGASEPARFRTHVIEGKMKGGYSVMLADMNHDGKLDIVPVGTGGPELAWYENPGWERHVMVNDKKQMLWAAANDIDGDGIPEVALLSDFGQDPKTSLGSVWLLKSQGNPREMWKSYKVDAVPTAYRVTWADLDGDGNKELVMAPFVGLKGWGNPKYQDNVPLLYWRTPQNIEDPWKRMVVDDKLYGVIHQVHAAKWLPGKRDQILTAGFDGIVLHRANGSGDNMKFFHKQLTKGDEARETPGAGMTKGSNDVYLLTIKGKRFFATQEPWHGDQVVVYLPVKGGEWQRRVIFKGFIQGHEMAVGDFNGDGRDDIVAVDVTNRARPTPASIHLFYSQEDFGLRWRHELVDEGQMAASGVVVADMNGDGRPDIVAISGGQVKYYENLGPSK